MRHLKTRFLVQTAIVGCLLLAIAACGGDDDNAGTTTNAPTAAPATAGLPSPALDRSSTPIKVVVSLPIFADMARIVGDNQIQVTTLIPPGADPHTYTPTEDMGDAVKQADVIFYNGLDLDGPTQRFIEGHLAPRPPLIVDFVRNVPSPSTQQPLDRPIYAKERGDNPHLFLDPVLVTVYPETISHSLTIKDNANGPYFDARFQAYRAQIDQLTQEITQTLSVIPEANRSLLITQHDSLVWFAKRFGLNVAGTLEGNGGDGLSEIIAQKHPPAVFTETGMDPAQLTQIAQAAGVKVCNIDTDAVSDASIGYLQMMENNAATIADCLK